MRVAFYKITRSACLFLPNMFVILAVVFCCLPSHIPYFITPSLEIILIYYFYIFTPGALSVPFVFCVGILQDVLLGMPLGISSTNNLILMLIMYNQVNLLVNRSFLILFVALVLTSLFCTITKVCIAYIFFDVYADYVYIVLQWLMSILLYPCMQYFLHSTFMRLYEEAYR